MADFRGRAGRTAWSRIGVGIGIGVALGLPLSASIARSAQENASTVTRIRTDAISSAEFESHAAIDPKTGDFWFVRSAKDFTGWRIMVSRCAQSRHMAPVASPFAGSGIEADPGFSADGRFLYYISTRASGSTKSRDLDIWRVDRQAGLEWAAPERLPTPVNSGESEWFPRPNSDGWLYFGSNRAGGYGGNDIWRARQDPVSRWTVENAGSSINSAEDEYEALPSPDGRIMIIEASSGYYISRFDQGVWSRRERAGPKINANGSEIGALFSPSGKSILFARDTGEPASGEFFLWRFGGSEDWPQMCR